MLEPVDRGDLQCRHFLDVRRLPALRDQGTLRLGIGLHHLADERHVESGSHQHVHFLGRGQHPCLKQSAQAPLKVTLLCGRESARLDQPQTHQFLSLKSDTHVDERPGQAGQRPIQVGRSGRLNQFLQLLRHRRSDGDSDEGMDQRGPLADVPGQRETGLQGVYRLVVAAFRGFQPGAQGQQIAELTKGLQVGDQERGALLAGPRKQLPVAVLPAGGQVHFLERPGFQDQ